MALLTPSIPAIVMQVFAPVNPELFLSAIYRMNPAAGFISGTFAIREPASEGGYRLFLPTEPHPNHTQTTPKPQHMQAEKAAGIFRRLPAGGG
jgi:hypothetical protein